MVKSIIIRIAIVLVGISIVVAGRGLFFYSGFYRAATVEMPSYEHIVVPPAPTTEFSDVYKEGKGIILIDLAHNNAFDPEELNVLILRLVSRGMTVRFLSEHDDLKKELLGNAEKKVEEEELEVVNAFVVVCPRLEFSKDEKETIDKFVSNSGKLLLIADPTRYGKMNSLSLKFSLVFEPDFLYNMKENEINYRNIFVAEFKENELTKEVEKIALYTAGSISSANSSIAFVDENTFSSLVETRKRLSPIALAEKSRVLAVYDFTFMMEPYNGILDNNQLIRNIADWLASPAESAAEAREKGTNY